MQNITVNTNLAKALLKNFMLPVQTSEFFFLDFESRFGTLQNDHDKWSANSTQDTT